MNEYDVGDQVRCTGTVTNAAGSVVDPTLGSITFKFKTPSGSITSYVGTASEVVKSSTGVYYVDVSITEAGMWWYRFQSTAGAIGAEESQFYVVPTEF